MPFYDRRCVPCGLVTGTDLYEPLNAENPACPTCGASTERIAAPYAAQSDDIPGGVEIRHGLCNPDGSPRRYYSKTEMTREAKRRGLMNLVEHIPSRGSDKNANTQRWV